MLEDHHLAGDLNLQVVQEHPAQVRVGVTVGDMGDIIGVGESGEVTVGVIAGVAVGVMMVEHPQPTYQATHTCRKRRICSEGFQWKTQLMKQGKS